MVIKNCCDVNVIFSLNLEDQFKLKMDSYIKNIKSYPFISLRSVKETFIATFSNKIKEMSDLIISSVNETKEELSKRNKRLGPPSSTLEEVTFKKYLSSALKSNGYSVNDKKTEKYMKLIFGNVPTFNDLKNSEKLTEFRENSLKNADHITIDAWDKFRKNFTNFKDAPRFNSEKQLKWEKKIKELKETEEIFNDVDNEDIFIATEYLTYIDDRGTNLKFSGNDKDLVKSLNKVKRKLNLNYPDAVYLLDN